MQVSWSGIITRAALTASGPAAYGVGCRARGSRLSNDIHGLKGGPPVLNSRPAAAPRKSPAIVIIALALLLALWILPQAVQARKSGGRKPPPKPVKIGVFFPMTGADALSGQSAYKGLMLARKHRPLVLENRPVELLLTDTGSRPEGVTKAVKGLIVKDKVTAVIGGLRSPATGTAAPLVEAAGVPSISPLSDRPGLAAPYRFVFSAAHGLNSEGGAAATFFRESLKARSAALMVEEGDPGLAAAAGRFEADFTAAGGRVVSRKVLAADNRPDLADWAEAIIDGRPDAVLLCGGQSFTALAAQSLRLAGYQRPLVGLSPAAGPGLIRQGGQAVEGLYLVEQFAPMGVKTALGRRFVRACRSEYPIIEPDTAAALAYEAYHLLVSAIEKAGTTDGPAVARALAAPDGAEGLLGKVIFSNGQAVKPVVVMMVKQGRIHWLSTIGP